MQSPDTQIILWILGQTLAILSATGFALYRFGRAVATFEAIGRQQASELEEVQAELKALSKVVTELALQSQRQDTMERRLNRAESLLEDIRRGEGFILPLDPRVGHKS